MPEILKNCYTLCPPLKPGSQDKDTDSAEISTRFSDVGFSGAPSFNCNFLLQNEMKCLMIILTFTNQTMKIVSIQTTK